jgi:hypothetical protein
MSCGRCVTENESTETMQEIKTNPTIRALAERLIAYEAAVDRTSQADFSDTCHVCERLRRALVKLFGVDGYRMTMARALILAKREASQLIDVKVDDDGSIKGLTGEATEANGVLISCFLELMETFLGEAATVWLLNDIWPHLPASGINMRTKLPR